MQLPLISDPNMAQAKWKSILDPLLAKPLSSGQILTQLTIKTGSNVINHKLGREPQGWFLTDNTTNITLYRSAPFNDLTLTLTSSGNGVINLMVF